MKDGYIVDRGRRFLRRPFGNGNHRPAQDLAGPRLWQPIYDDTFLEGGHRPDLMPDESNAIPFDVLLGALGTCIEADQPQRRLPLEPVSDPDDSSLGNCPCRRERFGAVEFLAILAGC